MPAGWQVRRVLVTAGDEIAGVYFGKRLAGDGPVRRRCDGIFAGRFWGERFARAKEA